jgi:hypothetical protein
MRKTTHHHPSRSFHVRINCQTGDIAHALAVTLSDDRQRPHMAGTLLLLLCAVFAALHRRFEYASSPQFITGSKWCFVVAHINCFRRISKETHHPNALKMKLDLVTKGHYDTWRATYCYTVTQRRCYSPCTLCQNTWVASWIRSIGTSYDTLLQSAGSYTQMR